MIASKVAPRHDSCSQHALRSAFGEAARVQCLRLSNRFHNWLHMVDTFDSSAASVLDIEHHRLSNLASIGAHKPGRAARVVWREHEKRIVASEMGQLMRRDPRCRPLRALLQAQQVLPANRRRAIQSWAQMRPQLEAYLHETADPRLSREPPAPARGAALSLPVAQAPAAAEDERRAPVSAPLMQVDSGAAARRLVTSASVIGKQLRARVDGALVELLGRAFEAGAKAALAQLADPLHATASAPADGHDIVAQPEPQAASTSPQKLQVLVAGLYPSRRAELIEELSHAVRLTFWHTDLPRGQLADMIGKSDIAIAMTDFADTQTIAQMSTSGSQYVAHPGGVERLKARILSLAQAEPRRP